MKPAPLLLLAAASLGLGVLMGRSILPAHPASHHPHPRPGVTATHVLGPDRVADAPAAAPAFAAARGVPEVLDGVRCYCHCDVSFGHRSLLSCFEDEHGKGCTVCQREAVIAYRVHQAGGNLSAVRDSVDRSLGPQGGAHG